MNRSSHLFIPRHAFALALALVLPPVPATAGGPPSPDLAPPFVLGGPAAAPGLEPAGPPREPLALPRVARPLAAQFTIEYDEIGGDDVVVTTAGNLVQHSMDIAANGDVYIAVLVYLPGVGTEIRVYRSTDHGDSWTLWSTLGAPGTFYRDPCLHAATANQQNLVFLAYSRSNGVEYELFVASSPPGGAAASWTTATVMSQPGVNFVYPDLSSDQLSVSGYTLVLVAEADDGNGTDVAFSRSASFGNTWEDPYEIATLDVGSRDYRFPTVRLGQDGIVHTAWYFYDRAGTTDGAVRYRRALNRAAGGPADWNATVYLTPNNNGLGEVWPSLAASPGGDTVAVAYQVDSLMMTSGACIRASYDGGATWPAEHWAKFAEDIAPRLKTVPGKDGFCMVSEKPMFDALGIRQATPSNPLTWSDHLCFVDRDYFDGLGHFATFDFSAAKGNRIALVWSRTHEDAAPDTLFFDAEWRNDPGYPNVEPGFPLVLDAEAESPPAICELDEDPCSEIVFSDALGRVQALNHDGTAVPGWPVAVGSFHGSQPVAVGDLDGDGRAEVVTGDSLGGVHVLAHDGTTRPGWPVSTGNFRTYVALGAILPGSPLQVVVCGGFSLHVFMPDGTEVPGFPVGFASSLMSLPAIGDVDGDGDREIAVLEYASQMHVVRGDGTIQANRNLLGTGKTFWRSPTLGDLNLDGDLEIVAPTRQGDVYVFNPDGSDFPGFPFDDPAGVSLTSVAIANIRGAQEPELVYASEGTAAPQVRALWADGTTLSGFPRMTDPGWWLWPQPVIDVLDNGSSDIVIGGHDSKVYAWSNFGIDLPGWPRDLVPEQFDDAAATGDIDQDGRVEVVLVGWGTPSMIVIDAGGLVQRTGDKRRWSWPMYAYDAQRQGCFACGTETVSGTPDAAPHTLAFAAARPNPATERVNLRFTLPAAAKVTLAIHDVAGRVVRTLEDAELAAGAHERAWNGADAHGARVRAGVYFARLAVEGGEEIVRRVVLLP